MVVGFLTACSSSQKPPNRLNLIVEAEADLDAGRYTQALKKLNRLLAEDPHNEQARIDLGWVYLYHNRPEKTAEIIRQLEAEHLNSHRLQHLKGKLFARLGQPVDALEAYNRALTSKTTTPQLHEDIAHAFLELNEPKSALNSLNTALRLDPANSRLAFQKCAVLRRLKQYDAAQEACDTALKYSLDPVEREQIITAREQIKLLQILN